MALTYRTPIEEIITAFDSNVQATIASTSGTYYKAEEEKNFSLFNLSLLPEAKRKLSMAGIYLSPFSAMPHSHPACKTLENYILYKVLPSYLDSQFYFVGIKDFKLDLLKMRNASLDMVSNINRYVTSLDRSRYGSDLHRRSTSTIPTLRRHAGGLASASLKDLVPSLASVRANKVFIHDELHYWTVRDLLTFLEVLQPETLLGTIVFPPEVLAGSTRSLNKWCYEYEIVDRRLLFYPDGVRGEAYEQPLDGGFLLKTSKLLLPNGTTYCVDVIHSKFAHHLVAITRGEALTPTMRAYGPFDATCVSGLEKYLNKVDTCFPVQYDIVSKVYRYLRTLKKPDVQSAMAKLGQLIPDPSGIEIKFLQDFANLVIGTKSVNTMIAPNVLKNFMGGWFRKLPVSLADIFPIARELSLDEFVSKLSPYHYKCPLAIVDWETALSWELFTFEEAEYGCDLPNLMDAAFMTNQTVEHTLCRDRTPYIGLAPLKDSRQYLLHVDPRRISAWFAVHYLNRYANHQSRAFSYSHFEGVFRSFGSKGASRCYLKPNFSTVNLRASFARVMRLARRAALGYFYELALAWFGYTYRGFVKYLEAVPENIAFPMLQKNLFALVTREVTSVPPRLRLRKCNYNHGIQSAAEQIGTSIRTNVVQESGRECADASCSGVAAESAVHIAAAVEAVPRAVTATLSCNCGISCALTARPDASLHNFEAPDQLRGRSAGWYCLHGLDYTYNGGSHECLGWPNWLRVWMELNGVDAEYYNSCLYQVYDEGSSIGFHADDEGVFVCGGKIFTCNITGEAYFRVKGRLCYGDVELTGGMSFEMPFNFQETHKHAVTARSHGRASVTFRRVITPESSRNELESDRGEAVTTPTSPVTVESQDSVEQRVNPNLGGENGLAGMSALVALEHISNLRLSCACNDEPKEYKSNLTCEVDGSIWSVLGFVLGLEPHAVERRALKYSFGLKCLDEELKSCNSEDGLLDVGIAAAALTFSLRICVLSDSGSFEKSFEPNVYKTEIVVALDAGKYSLVVPKNDCAVVAISSALAKKIEDVLTVIKKRCDPFIYQQIWAGAGVTIADMDLLFELFGIHAEVRCNGEVKNVNPAGRIKAVFEIGGEHIVFKGQLKIPAVPALRAQVEGLTLSSASKELLLRAGTVIPYCASLARAKTLSGCMHGGCTGVMSSELFSGRHDYLKDYNGAELKQIDVHCILGTFGSGKSTLLVEVFKRSQGRMITYVSPRKALAQDFSQRLGMRPDRKGRTLTGQNHWYVLTFEVFLAKLGCLRAGSTIIIDEVQLYPPGYLDLVCLLAPADAIIVVAGDPCQSDYYCEKDTNFLSLMDKDHVRLLRDQSYAFNTLSLRFRNPVLIGRLPCEMPASLEQQPRIEIQQFEGVNSLLALAEGGYTFLVSSFDEKKIVATYGLPESESLTFGESTGLSRDKVCILITHVSHSTSEVRWITALSRARKEVAFVNLCSFTWESVLEKYVGKALHKFMTKTACLDDLKLYLPGIPIWTSSYSDTLGKDEGMREEKLQGDPWLKCMIDLLQIEDMEEAEECVEVADEAWFKTHLPQAELESVRARWVHKILAKEAREVRLGSIVSEQFTDEHSKQLGLQLTNAAERFETIYPRHRANDTVTFLMAVKKRLRFSRPAVECAKLNDARLYGRFLLGEFLKKVPLKRHHDVVMMANAKAAFEDKKTSKSAATIENHAERSCRDWLIDIGLIFSKSQICTKFDNRFRVAKAAQSIVCFQHEVLARFAPYMRYIEMKLQEVLPKTMYVHSGKGLEELNAWVMRGNFGGLCTESDYEAFDASQDQYIMAFELAIMEHLNLPRDLINDYIYIKTHLGSKLGNFAIMRFSGEASTFLFNTMANMLFTFLRYELKGNDFLCFAGDDMCANRRLAKKRDHEHFLDKLKLKAKVMVTNKPTFCGWHLCPDGIYKKPQLVLERMCIAKETNNLHNCIDNYAIEVAFAYKLGERAVNRMDEEELEAFYNCVRIIIKNKHLLKSDVRDVFANSTP